MLQEFAQGTSSRSPCHELKIISNPPPPPLLKIISNPPPPPLLKTFALRLDSILRVRTTPTEIPNYSKLPLPLPPRFYLAQVLASNPDICYRLVGSVLRLVYRCNTDNSHEKNYYSTGYLVTIPGNILSIPVGWVPVPYKLCWNLKCAIKDRISWWRRTKTGTLCYSPVHCSYLYWYRLLANYESINSISDPNSY